MYITVLYKFDSEEEYKNKLQEVKANFISGNKTVVALSVSNSFCIDVDDCKYKDK